MTQISYRVLTDQHSHYLDTLKETKQVIEKCKLDGDSNIKIFRIIAVEIDAEEIELDEKLLALDN